MDLKGIAWVGNVYQKFEALCLEVEDNMYEDTVKYVESQVQTVGASVKKFYSDVLQDILPLPEADPVKTSATDLTMENYTGTKMYKKPKLCAKEEDMKSDAVKNTQDLNVVAEMVKHADNRSLAGEPQSLSDKLRPSPNVADAISSAENDLVRPSEFHNQSHEIASERINVASCPDSDLSVGSELKSEEEERRSEGMSQPNGLVPPVYNTAHADSEHIEPEHIEPATTAGLMTDDEFGSSDSWDTNPYEETDEIEVGMESSYVIDAGMLHESCVLVDGAKPSFVPPKKFKQKSYKKKIRDAIFLKKKTSRNREYEQLAAQYEDIQAGSSVSSGLPICVTDSKTKVIKGQGAGESEWELL